MNRLLTSALIVGLIVALLVTVSSSGKNTADVSGNSKSAPKIHRQRARSIALKEDYSRGDLIKAVNKIGLELRSLRRSHEHLEQKVKNLSGEMHPPAPKGNDLTTVSPELEAALIKISDEFGDLENFVYDLNQIEEIRNLVNQNDLPKINYVLGEESIFENDLEFGQKYELGISPVNAFKMGWDDQKLREIYDWIRGGTEAAAKLTENSMVQTVDGDWEWPQSWTDKDEERYYKKIQDIKKQQLNKLFSSKTLSKSDVIALLNSLEQSVDLFEGETTTEDFEFIIPKTFGEFIDPPPEN